MAGNLIPQHKRMAMGADPEVSGVDSPWKSIATDKAVGRSGLKDSQRGVNRRGDDADHGEY